MKAVATTKPSTRHTASSAGRSISEMFGILERPWVMASALFGCVLMRTASPVLAAVFTKSGLDGFSSADAFAFYLGGALLVVAHGMDALGAGLGKLLQMNAVEGVAAALRSKFVRRAVGMPYAEYETMTKGDLVSRVTGDVNEAAIIFVAVHSMLENVTRAFGAIGILFFFTPELGFATVGVLALSNVLNLRITRPIGALAKKYQGTLGSLATYALSAIEGRVVIKSYLAEGRMGEKFVSRAEEGKDQAIAVGKQTSLATFFAFIGAYGTLLVTFGYGAYLAVVGRITFGTMLASLTLTDYITPLGFLGGSMADVHKCSGAYERVREILEAEPDCDLPSASSGQTDEARRSWALKGRPVISVQGLSYEYVPGIKALDDISFEIYSGQKVAVVGRSGCGKSTLMKSLSGLYRSPPEKVFIGGEDMAYRRLEAGVKQATYVPQVPFLLAGTIQDNLALGRRGVKQDVAAFEPREMSGEVRKALASADALEYVSALPDGLHTDVGERGSLLSGGERQRICLARGFLRGAPILLLDEPTSSVDKGAEARILAAIRDLTDTTCIMVTHRLDIAQMADLVLVLDCGKLVEADTHRNLIERGGLYWSLVTGRVSLSSSSASSGVTASVGGLI